MTEPTTHAFTPSANLLGDTVGSSESAPGGGCEARRAVDQDPGVAPVQQQESDVKSFGMCELIVYVFPTK